MKLGIILYIVGDLPDDWNEDVANIIKQLGIQADAVEIVVSSPGSYDIHDAWWRLSTRGIHKIMCKLALFDEMDNLIFTGKELRLSG